MPENRLSATQPEEVARRAYYCCEYCWSQERFSPDSFSVEHIVPLSKGGTNEVENLAFSCQGCNNRKYTSTAAMDPVTQEVVSLHYPRTDPWGKHFAWNEDFSVVIGISPIGRATVEKLQLNRIGLINLRQVLFRMNEHPPLLGREKI